MKSKDWNVRKRAAEVIGKIAEANPGTKKVLEAVPALMTALKDEDSEVRKSAAEAIGTIAEKHPEYDWEAVVPYLITALKDKNWYVRERAAEAIEKIVETNPDSKEVLEAVPDLITALKDENWFVRERAAEALEKIIGRLIEKGEFEEALETIRSTTTTIMNFYKGAFRTARKKNKTMGKDRDLLEERIKLLEKLDSLTNEVYTRVKEKEGLPNPLNEKEPMEWKGVKTKQEANIKAKKGCLELLYRQ